MTSHAMSWRIWTVAAVAICLGSAWLATAQSWKMSANDTLECGESLYSGNGNYVLRCDYVYSEWLDDDTYQLTFDYVGPGISYGLWGSTYDDAFGSGHQYQYASNYYGGLAVMQGDGNFVFYDSFSYYYDMSSTSTCCIPGEGTYLNAQDDANLVVYDEYDTPLWAIY